MAERGAYLTGTATYGKPTIFEIVAQESLASTLEPTFKKIFTFLATCNVERYGWVLQWSDEVYTVFHGLLQSFYIKNYNSSFSETFYGLERISLLNSKVASKLTKKQEILSLVFLILHPYLKSKAVQFELQDWDRNLTKKNWKIQLRIYFFQTFRIYNFVRSFVGIYYYLLYISNRSPYSSPLLRLLSVTLTYNRNAESITISEYLSRWKEGTYTTNDGVNLLLNGFTKSLELGAFFLQFVNWWNQENFSMNLLSLPVPLPPTVPGNAKKYKGLCPICIKVPNIPTALAVSGYVFCYQCILEVIRSDKICPVTHYPAIEDDLIRLYVN